VQIRVYYEDTDIGGVVYYANYFKFIERARSELFFAQNKTPFDIDGHFVVQKLDANFISSARFGDMLDVYTTLDGYSKASITLKQCIKKDDKDSKKSESKIKTVQIDFDKIYERVVQVTNFAGDEANVLISKDGETFYYTANSSTAKGRDMYSIKWNGKDLKELTKGGSNPGNLYIDKENKYLPAWKRQKRRYQSGHL
jgi:tol-pal system-associated acyl-CoA thioesterase